MQTKHAVAGILLAAILATQATPASAKTNLAEKTEEIGKSLVIVEYTFRNENSSREEAGQGIVVSKDGVILISGGLIPESFPVEWVKDIKVRLPLKEFTSAPAKFLGRTQDRLFAFIKVEKPIDAPPFEPGELAPSTLGQEIYAIAILGKAEGYERYVAVSRVRLLAQLTHIFAETATFGLTRGTSPVFDMETGKCVGITIPSMGDTVVMRDARGYQQVELTDEDQSSAYLPKEEIKDLFTNIPTAPFEQPRSWIGVDGLTGLQEDVRDLKKIDQVAGVMVGSVIPGEAADKAGLLAQDIILTINGKPFSTSPVPELMTMHFSSVIEKFHPGDIVTLGILRDTKKLDIAVKMEATPKTSAEMPHVFSARIGVVTRDLAFADAYARRLPQDTKGVAVALVKNGSPASLGATPLHVGDLITKVDDQPIENQKQFLDLMKASETSDAKEMVFVVIQPNGDTQVARIDLTK